MAKRIIETSVHTTENFDVTGVSVGKTVVTNRIERVEDEVTAVQEYQGPQEGSKVGNTTCGCGCGSCIQEEGSPACLCGDCEVEGYTANDIRTCDPEQCLCLSCLQSGECDDKCISGLIAEHTSDPCACCEECACDGCEADDIKKALEEQVERGAFGNTESGVPRMPRMVVVSSKGPSDLAALLKQLGVR